MGKRMISVPDELRARIERIRAWADEHGGSFDSTESIRAERDAR